MSLPIPVPAPSWGDIVGLVRKPKLLAFLPKDDPSVQQVLGRAFFHAGVKNTSSIPITKARVLVRVRKEGQDVTSYLAKWDFTPEPFVAYAPNAAISPQLLVESQVHYVLPAVAETFALFVKFQGHDELYTFSPFSYLQPNLQLSPPLQVGEYSVEVIIAAENYRGVFGLKVENHGSSFGDVRLSRFDNFTASKGFKRMDWL